MAIRKYVGAQSILYELRVCMIIISCMLQNIPGVQGMRFRCFSRSACCTSSRSANHFRWCLTTFGGRLCITSNTKSQHTSKPYKNAGSVGGKVLCSHFPWPCVPSLKLFLLQPLALCAAHQVCSSFLEGIDSGIWSSHSSIEGLLLGLYLPSAVE